LSEAVSANSVLPLGLSICGLRASSDSYIKQHLR
jgi:hypothetical protein